MTGNQYIGVEQEFTTFRDTSRRTAAFNMYFEEFTAKEKPFFRKSDTAIRTPTGHAAYVDGNEIEICTPPVRINKGFAQRLTDLVLIGRDKLASPIQNTQHTGYSMHWSLSSDGGQDCDAFYKGIAVPFMMFGLNPLSCGMNLRKKDSESGEENRLELLGDYISDPDQIASLALMLASYKFAFENRISRVPITPDILFDEGDQTNNFLWQGRFTKVESNIMGANDRSQIHEIQVQDYLELFHEWIRPYARELGSREENEVLEDFIMGRRKLEFDQFKYFAYMQFTNLKHAGAFLPHDYQEKVPEKRIIAQNLTRNLPLEGKLLGEMVKTDRHKIAAMDWSQIKFTDGQTDRAGNPIVTSTIRGLDAIYEYAKNLNDSFTALEETPEIVLRNVERVNSLNYRVRINTREYNPADDTFSQIPTECTKEPEPVEKISFTRRTGKYIKKMLKRDWGVIAGIAIAGAGLTAITMKQSKETNLVKGQIDYIMSSGVSTNAISNVVGDKK